MSLRRMSPAEELPECIDIAAWAAKSPDGCLTFGRDKHHLRLDSTAAPRMLSRSHCRLRVAGRNLALLDLGSTNGTCYATADAPENVLDAPANVEVTLPPGSIIYLGGGMFLELEDDEGRPVVLANPAAYLYVPPPPPGTPSPMGTTRTAVPRTRAGDGDAVQQGLMRPPAHGGNSSSRRAAQEAARLTGGVVALGRPTAREQAHQLDRRQQADGSPQRQVQQEPQVNEGEEREEEQMVVETDEGEQEEQQEQQQPGHEQQQQQQQQQQNGQEQQRLDPESQSPDLWIVGSNGPRSHRRHPVAAAAGPSPGEPSSLMPRELQAFFPESQDSGSVSVGSRPVLRQLGAGAPQQLGRSSPAQAAQRQAVPGPHAPDNNQRRGDEQSEPAPVPAVGGSHPAAVHQQQQPPVQQPFEHQQPVQQQQQQQREARQQSPDSEDELAAEATCAVCRELFVSPFSLQCGHAFCGACLQSWLARKAQCPSCRAAVTAPPRPNRTVANIAGLLAARGAGGSQSTRDERVRQWRAVDEAVQRDWEVAFSSAGRAAGGGAPAGGNQQQQQPVEAAQPRPQQQQHQQQTLLQVAGRNRLGVSRFGTLRRGGGASGAGGDRGRGGARGAPPRAVPMPRGGRGTSNNARRARRPAWVIPVDALFPPQ